MKHCIPYARTDIGSSKIEDVVEWLGINELLARLRMLPPDKEFSILLDFLAAFAGGLETAEHRMAEMLVEQAAISYMAYAEAVRKIKGRLVELYGGRLGGDGEGGKRWND